MSGDGKQERAHPGPLLRHPGSAVAGVHEGNRMYLDAVYAGPGGLARSCGKCGKHQPSQGSRVIKPWGWCCAGCVAARRGA